MNPNRLLERFLQYVKIDTTAVEQTDAVPSSPGQVEMGKLLVEQLSAMGLADVSQDQYGIVMGTIPGTTPAPKVVFNSHMDTSPDASGKDVKPNVITNFDGQDIPLSGDPSKIITSATCPELVDAKGKTIITTDGTTLLGGDDKAGVAIIMELACQLMEHPEIPHGPVTVMFTCDEEVGRGIDHVDVAKLNATACYNFDGGGRNRVDAETFSADLAVVTVSGVNIHPSIGKGRMVSAIRAASHFIAALPPELSPERADGRDGFMHPYALNGNVAQATVRILLRDFETEALSRYADQLKKIAQQTCDAFPGAEVSVDVSSQYRNMREGLANEPRAVDFALRAHEILGRQPQKTIVRGGTDGSRLTELGLPTPNLSSGQHNIHSPLEWACLDEMVEAAEVGLEIVKLWGAEVV